MIILPATIESISTRADRTIKIVVGTQETTPEKAGNLFQLMNKIGYVAIKEANFQPDEIEALTDIDEDLNDSGKTPSKRLRNVFYLLFQKDNEGFKSFQEYYPYKMERLIQHFKNKIDGE